MNVSGHVRPIVVASHVFEHPPGVWISDYYWVMSVIHHRVSQRLRYNHLHRPIDGCLSANQPEVIDREPAINSDEFRLLLTEFIRLLCDRDILCRGHGHLRRWILTGYLRRI